MSHDLAGKSIAGLLRLRFDASPNGYAIGLISGNSVDWTRWCGVQVMVNLEASCWVKEAKTSHTRSADSLYRDVPEILAFHELGLPRVPEWDRYFGDYPSQFASIVETAGTSGVPRGVMLTEQNLASNAIALSEASGGDGDELRLSFLPMEHLYARTCDLYTWIVRGSRLVLAESPKTVFRDAKLVKPTVKDKERADQLAKDKAEREAVASA